MNADAQRTRGGSGVSSGVLASEAVESGFTNRSHSWSTCLFMALAALVLPAPSRNGRRHALRYEKQTRRRCVDWISGIRADLWSPGSVVTGEPRKKPNHDPISDVLPDSVVPRDAKQTLRSAPRTTWSRHSAFSAPDHPTVKALLLVPSRAAHSGC